jgi:hypothetical protein
MRRVVAYVPDLMDRSRLSSAASVHFVATPAELPAAAEGADLVVVDLSRPGVLDVLPLVAVPTIGFGSHVDRALLGAAREAGCQEVLARSAFFSRVAELLG